MPNSDYPDLIDRLADGALSRMRVFPAHGGAESVQNEASSRSMLVFPAHAGLIRSRAMRLCPILRVPRARGADPASTIAAVSSSVCSPRTRG